MATIETVLQAKGERVVTIQPDRTIKQAIETLVEHGIGSLLVVEGRDEIVGILTERDVLREVNQHCNDVPRRRVGEVMTRDVIIAFPDDDLDYVMWIMTENRIRHLPVMQNGKLRGLISIGDVVKAQKSLTAYEVRLLRDYITGKYPG